MKNFEILRVYDQENEPAGYYLLDEEIICKAFCEANEYSYEKEKIFQKI